MTDGLNNSGGKAGACGRGEELVAYLYGEARPREARGFEAHLESCAACRAELSAFGAVRREVAAWREQVMREAPRVEFVPASAPARAAAQRTRSARAALREFFALSPAWLRAAGVAAAVAVCGLAALVFARTEVSWDARGLALRAGVPERTVVERVEAPAGGAFTAEQVDEIAARRVREALAAARAEAEVHGGGVVTAGEGRREERGDDAVTSVPVRAVRPTRPGQLAAGRRGKRRGLEYLPVAEEDELPRLSDLLGEAN